MIPVQDSKEYKAATMRRGRQYFKYDDEPKRKPTQ
jgi:hypothetical protein